MSPITGGKRTSEIGYSGTALKLEHFLARPAEMNMFGIVVIVALATASLVACCPPAADLAPHCFCKKLGRVYVMSCNGILRPEELEAPLRSVSMHGTKMFSLLLQNSTLKYIPHGIFQGTAIKKVYFVNSKVKALSDTDVAFGGLEKSLTEIRATAAEYIASWDWQQLRNHRKLDLIDVNRIVMGKVDKPFPRLPRLSALGITRAGISHIVDKAFEELTGLRILSLAHNDITELKRNMLPYPADFLRNMDFSDNQMSSLPEDIFSGMPNIEVVILDRNKFVTLTEYPFASAFGRLKEFSIDENPIQCDCRLRWIGDVRTPSDIQASCSAPESLKGRQISQIDVKHFLC